MRTFAPHQRPQGQRFTQPGDELVGGADGSFQLRRHDNQVLSRPDGVYNFVRVQGMTRNQSATVMSARAPHASLADGRPVLYAGTAAFDGGKLQWWSNYSGTYQPQAEFHRQAALPDDKFVPWQRLQLGGVGLQRGMLSDHRGVTLPDKEAEKGATKTEPAPQPATKPTPAPDKAAAAPATAQTLRRTAHPPPPTRFGPPR